MSRRLTSFALGSWAGRCVFVKGPGDAAGDGNAACIVIRFQVMLLLPCAGRATRCAQSVGTRHFLGQAMHAAANCAAQALPALRTTRGRARECRWQKKYSREPSCGLFLPRYLSPAGHSNISRWDWMMCDTVLSLERNSVFFFRTVFHTVFHTPIPCVCMCECTCVQLRSGGKVYANARMLL